MINTACCDITSQQAVELLSNVAVNTRTKEAIAGDYYGKSL